MARIFPFQPYRYSASAGPLDTLATQPYDKISPAMQARYLSLSPYNFVRIILGQRFPADDDHENVYTRAAAYFNQWIREGILVRESKPCLLVYFQEFEMPDSGERLVRKGFIGLAQLEEYEARVVFRHEQTLSGPKKDRLELVEHTGAHLEQLFLMYPDPAGEVDAILDQHAQGEPAARMRDELGALHTIWKIDDAGTIARIQELMSDQKLVIADGHHRYETALNFARANPDWPDAQRVMMTLVNVHSPGLRILATHRVLSGIGDFAPAKILEGVGRRFQVEALADAAALRARWATPRPDHVRFGMVLEGDPHVYALEALRRGEELDLQVLHRELIEGVLGVSPEAVREERANLTYVRGMDAAVEMVRRSETRRGEKQIAFLVEAATVEQVAKISLAGGVMPQKSTDFYPKLLSGLAIYKLEK